MKMQVLLLFLISTIFSGQVWCQEEETKECVPAYEYIPFVGAAANKEKDGSIALGAYSRVSPDGNYVLRSLSGSYLSAVTLMKLTSVGVAEPAARAIQTSLQLEAFPLMGSWRFLGNPSGHYYRFEDIVKSGKGAKAQFRGGVSGFYTTAAELEAREDGRLTMRSLSWPQGNAENGTQGTGQLENKITVLSRSKGNTYSVISDSRSQYLCGNLRSSEGNVFTLPMISQDGREFSAMPVSPADKKSTMRIYEVAENHKDCRLVDDLKVLTSKVIFGYKSAYFDKAPVVFKGASSGVAGGTGVYVYERGLKRSIELDGAPLAVQASDFPGFTKDGRVVFSGTWRTCSSTGACQRVAGYVRVDPFQTPGFKKLKAEAIGATAKWPGCVPKREALQVEAAFLKSVNLLP